MLISGARRAFSCSADERTNQIKDERLGSVSTYVRTCRIRRRCGWCICRADRCAAGGSMRKHMASRTALLLLSTADTGTSAFMAPAFLCGGCTRDTYYSRARAPGRLPAFHVHRALAAQVHLWIIPRWSGVLFPGHGVPSYITHPSSVGLLLRFGRQRVDAHLELLVLPLPFFICVSLSPSIHLPI
jgi:hypothetical protein